MKTILEQLEVDINRPAIISTFGSAAQGKSTFMAYLIKELHDIGKNISIISDDKDSLWARRLINVGCNSAGAKIIYKELQQLSIIEVLDFIKNQKGVYPFIDCVVLDLPTISDKKSWNDLISFIRNNNMMLFTTQQFRIQSKESPYESVTTLKTGFDKMLTSDVVLSVTKKELKLSLWKRFLNFFRPLFGFKKSIPTNATLNVLKNRYGKDNSSIDYHLDFSKINK